MTTLTPDQIAEIVAKSAAYREASASCSLDGSTQIAGDYPPYVLTEDRVLTTEKRLSQPEAKS